MIIFRLLAVLISTTYARVAQLVERDLAKVEAAGSSPVSRSLELAQKYREIGISEFFILHRQGYNWGTIALFL